MTQKTHTNFGQKIFTLRWRATVVGTGRFGIYLPLFDNLKRNLKYYLVFQYILLSIPSVTSDAMSTPTESAKDRDVSESM